MIFNNFSSRNTFQVSKKYQKIQFQTQRLLTWDKEVYLKKALFAKDIQIKYCLNFWKYQNKLYKLITDLTHVIYRPKLYYIEIRKN